MFLNTLIFCEQGPKAGIQSAMLTFQGGSDENRTDFLYRVEMQYLDYLMSSLTQQERNLKFPGNKRPTKI